jgi:hypothetical protein
MKNIEQLIKDSLENHELPYDGAAWESMSKRLDGTTPSPFYRKWWVAASIGTVLVGSALFFGLNSQSESSKTVEENTPMATELNTALPTNNQTDNHSKTRINPQTNTPADIQNEPNTIAKTEEKAKPHLAINDIPEIPHPTNTTPNSSIKPKLNDLGLNGVNPTDQKNYLSVLLTQTNVCVGDDIEITNPNETLSISVVQNNRSQVIKAGGKKTITATKDGSIQVISGKIVQTIDVNRPTSDLYLSVDQSLLYENGIPAVKFTVSGNDNPVHWNSENNPSEVENGNLIVHAYQGKDITVSATSKDQNGCVVVETKTISISEEYNLNAAKGIDINSSDSRVSSFMPFALKERNTPFELYIYDSKTGRVIYKTSDVYSGWNGVDSNTGEVLKSGTVVLWKVIMGHPNPGEPREYKGTVVVKTN